MADTKFFADGNVDVILIRQSQLTNPAAPLITEVNTNGINVSNALAWDGTTWPTFTDSNDTDDRSIKDAGNASSRGQIQFDGTLNFFFPKNLNDTTSDFGKAYALLKDAATHIPLYIITRVGQTTTGAITALAAGDVVSVFKVTTDTFTADTEGDDSYKYSVTMLPQGAAYNSTQAVSGSLAAITATSPGTLTMTVGQKKALRATLNSKRMTNLVTWTSSDITKATVSANGVVTALAAGTVNITASHPAGTTSTPVALTIS